MKGDSKLTPAQVKQAAKCYRAGESIYDLAKAYGASSTLIWRHLKAAGVSFRDRRAIKEDRMARAEKLWMAGKTLTEIGKELGITRQRVSVMLKAYDRIRREK